MIIYGSKGEVRTMMGRFFRMWMICLGCSWNIWVMNADGTHQRQLTKQGGYNPLWSRMVPSSCISIIAGLPQ